MSEQQPMPTPGSANVTPVAVETFLRILAQQTAKGAATYGTELQANNGRNAVQDALEEAVDLFQYLVQIKMEMAALSRRNADLVAAFDDRLQALQAERNRLRQQLADLESERIALRLRGAP